MTTFFCPHCGQTHNPGTRFCPTTGQAIPVSYPCPKCGSDTEPGWRACPNCGLVLAGTAPIAARNVWARRLVIVGSIFLAVIIVACGVLYVGLGLFRTDQAARIVPADRTGILVSISPSLWQLPRLRYADRFAESAAVFVGVPGVLEVSQVIQNNLPVDLAIDPQADILPWMGREVSLAVLFSDESGSSILSTGRLAAQTTQNSPTYRGTPLIFAAATRNQNASDAFLRKLKTQMEREGVEFEVFTYQGIEITQIVSPDNVPFAYATYNRMVVIATDADTLFASIDTAMGNNTPALYEQAGYRETLGKLPGNRLGTIYFNVKAFEAHGGSEILSALPSRSFQAIEDMGLGFSLMEEGLRFDYLVNYRVNELPQVNIESLSQPANPHRLVNAAPADTFFYMSGQNLSRMWEIQANSSDGGEFLDLLPSDFVQRIALETGVHLENDLFANMAGEYAWLLVPDADSFLPQFGEVPLGLLFFVQAENTAHVERSLDGLASSFAQEEGLEFYTDFFNGVEVQVMQQQSVNFVWGYGFLEDTLFVGTSRNMLNQAASGNQISLADNELFQAAIEPLPNDSQGYLYLDVQEAVRLIYQAMSDREKEDFNAEIRPYVSSIQALTLATEPMDKDGSSRGVLFVLTQPSTSLP